MNIEPLKTILDLTNNKQNSIVFFLNDDIKSKLNVERINAVSTNIDKYMRKKPRVFLTISSLIERSPILNGIIALECNILRVSVAAYLNSKIILVNFMPPLVEPPIAPKNIKKKSAS